ncbi:TetR/AcrR family transcriptional regulator [Ktedonosporobacter rubrisoli]|uniref:TetR/AcrR family transcriptional regulator n=1 Tax=Ktedonosporobacter rubrisoli TaxID=2509675 RepID=A0A4V0YZ97_KTERU|nr:TetR/AcrR family transcriptional regulator [Ktedonosporobacter rubrisoli]QBD78961.1 TetR/AcrR family transcriptional regulator [Ktedonosporobacter rubrisoli]
MSETTNARGAILTAAERVIEQLGVKRLTIAQVAKEAGMSRGGILYHFASKEALIQGMLARFLEQFERLLAEDEANDPEPQGRFTRAYVRSSLKMDEEATVIFSALLAAIAYDPHLLDPLRAHLESWQRRTEEELDFTTAAIVRLASHAFWLNGLFAMNTFTLEERRRIVGRLEELTRPT